ncbi:catalase [Halorubrum sp. DTA98]|uniref:catalase n=1 Tax=Halorubrum sp. DTA98 TaxID=3402163 RepID=UPI003AAFC38E
MGDESSSDGGEQHDDRPEEAERGEEDTVGEDATDRAVTDGDATDGDATDEDASERKSGRRGTSGTEGDADEERKQRQLDGVREDPAGKNLTTDHGIPLTDTEDSLKAGQRGPTIMEDFHFREKMTQFDHERIPERVVHARGTGAHGYFEPYESPDLGEYDDISELTKAGLFQDPDTRTPVFVRFSTVVGFRGSADTVRDVRGFATKFYTEEGNWDLVGNNMPVFFIQDAMEFPDLVHAIKPEPDTGTPQAAAAHDTFWDFASLKPETTHTLMWVLSGRALPRAYRMMQGFGVHTFRLVNDAGEATFVKFHWTPTLGTHQLVWDETQTIAGKNPDFNRADLYDVIESGYEPEYELGVQIFGEAEAESFDFDVLDPTKIVPETEVPVRPIGRMVLNGTPDNFFAEVEQVAFHPGNVVSGIDVTNDPLLQGRLFSYQDTQINRFNSANWDEIPINRPLAERHNNQRDGFMRHEINEGPVSYKPNSIADDQPREASEEEGGYAHFAEAVSGEKTRERSDSFDDHFTQARLFWNSMADHEQGNIVEAACFELGKVERMEIRERTVYELFNNVDHEFAKRVAEGIGVEPPAEPGDLMPTHDRTDPSLSMANRTADTVETRKVAVLLEDGYDHEGFEAVRSELADQGARVDAVSTALGDRESEGGDAAAVDETYATTESVLYDAVFVPGGGPHAESLLERGAAKHFVAEAFTHKKPIAALGEGVDLLESIELPDVEIAEDEGTVSDLGVATSRGGDLDEFATAFVDAIAAHRHWERETEGVSA